jgi:hypothetical protein
MDPVLPGVESRLLAAIAETPPRIPVLLGPCGSGRTRALQRVRGELAPGACHYIDLERALSTPEQFLARITCDAALSWPAAAHPPSGPREAYDRTLAYLTGARARDGAPATLLLDEAFELRFFESFPGLQAAMAEALAAVQSSGNGFVLATKYEARALQALRQASDRFLVIHAEPVPVASVAADLLLEAGLRSDQAEDAARMIVALTEGRAAYVAALTAALGAPACPAREPVGALAAALSPGGALFDRCRYSYEIRLHRARGYGALKGVLAVLAEEEPLTLTEVAQRLQRTPGSTRDYLGWLEDVDLVHAHRKRYAFTDPVLRLWVRLYAGCCAPDERRVTEVVHQYAVARLSAGSAILR